MFLLQWFDNHDVAAAHSARELGRVEVLPNVALDRRQLREDHPVVLGHRAKRPAPHVLVRPLAGVQTEPGNGETGNQNHAGDSEVTGPGPQRTVNRGTSPFAPKRAILLPSRAGASR
jgi:hypothetical protein